MKKIHSPLSSGCVSCIIPKKKTKINFTFIAVKNSHAWYITLKMFLALFFLGILSSLCASVQQEKKII